MVSAALTSKANAVLALVRNRGTPPLHSTAPEPAGIGTVNSTLPPVPSRKSTYPAVAELLKIVIAVT